MYNHKKYQKKWRDSHKEEKKKWYKRNRHKYQTKYKDRQRAQCLIKKYGITVEQYNELFLKQNGCCSICKRHQSEFKRSFAVDHNNETKVVRGLLCHHCNIAIGHFFEDIDILQRAVFYLKESSI